MGRNAEPVDIIKAKGKSHHLTKDETKARKEAEIKLGLNDLKKLQPPEFIKDDMIAFSYWKKHLKEYEEAAERDIEIITTADIGILAMYCKTYADYERLLKSYQSIDKIVYDSEKLDDYIEDSQDFNYKIKTQLRNIIAIDGLLRIETAINKKMDMLIKMQDRLFLNPLAKVKNIAKKEKPKRDLLKEKGFGNV